MDETPNFLGSLETPMTQNETIKSTMSAIFKRKGQGGLYTRLLDDLDHVQQKLLLKHLQLTNEELPVLGSAESDDTWMILTTTRVVWSSNGNIQSLHTDDIVDVVADFRKLQATGHRKSQLRELQIVTASGQTRAFEVEPGSPLIGVWNAMKFLGRRNRHRCE